MFSAALCRGLIEASRVSTFRGMDSAFSAALCRGLIEAGRWRSSGDIGVVAAGFPRLYAAASLKQHVISEAARRSCITVGFPRLYAAASLKRVAQRHIETGRQRFSAALCRGLIEARPEPGCS